MTRFRVTPVWILVTLCSALVGCGTRDQTPSVGSATLQVTDLAIGDGTLATDGDFVVVNVASWLAVDGRPGEVLEDTHDLEHSPMFQLGKGMVFDGLERGITGMRVGGKRRLVIPPELAFGATGNERVPPNTTLIAEIELLKVPLVEREILERGEGRSAVVGDMLLIHYDGWIAENGEKKERFDSSLIRGSAIQITVGADEVIPGLDMGVVGMKQGGKSILTIPPELGYGHTGALQDGEVIVPPATTLIFEVELIEILRKVGA